MLNVAAVLDYTISQIVNVEDILMSTWSGCVTLAVSVGHFGDGSISVTAARAEFKAQALAAGINKNTIESYLKPMFEAADKLARMAGDEAWFAGLVEHDAADAVALIQAQLVALGMHSGSDIRAWAKQDDLGAFDRNAAKVSKAKPVAGPTGLFGKAVAMVPTTRANLASDAVKADALATAILALSAIDNASDLVKLMEALNAKMVAFQGLSDALPAPTVGVTADDATAHANSSIARFRDAA